MNGRSPQSAIDRIHQRELDELKNLTVHRDLAVAAALDYCVEEGITPPRWVVERAAALLRELLLREKAPDRGRIGNRITRYRNDQRDVERWDAVEEIRRIRKKTEYDAKLRRQYGETPENSRNMYHHERMLEWLRNGTFECASRYLAGREARIGADAMRASHRRCLRRAGTGSFPDRYYVLDQRFLKKLGIPGLQERKRGTKLLPLYDLT
jgi:hypothetical protein